MLQRQEIAQRQEFDRTDDRERLGVDSLDQQKAV
jgi:hypothetical protein